MVHSSCQCRQDEKVGTRFSVHRTPVFGTGGAGSSPARPTDVYGRQNRLRDLARRPVNLGTVIPHGRCKPMLVAHAKMFMGNTASQQ